jgi:heptosyltransferase-2
MPRALLIAPQWIGDAVMAQPLVAMLAARGEQVAALGLRSIAPVLRAMPGVTEVIEAPFRHGRLDIAARWHIATVLRAGGYARAYILGNNVKSRLVPWLAGIPERIGYAGEASGLLLTCKLHAQGHSGRADMRKHYAQLAGADAHAALAEPTLQVAPDIAASVRARFGLPARWIAVCPGAEYGPAKQWPVPHYGALALRAQRDGYAVAVLGAPSDVQAGEAIARLAPHAMNLCGRTRLDEAIALLAGASGVVSNDSGLMHIAAALNRPTIGIYGSTDPRHTPPAAHHSATLWLHLPCSPCFARACPLGHLNCLRGILPETAWAALEGLMQD